MNKIEFHLQERYQLEYASIYFHQSDIISKTHRKFQIIEPSLSLKMKHCLAVLFQSTFYYRKPKLLPLVLQDNLYIFFILLLKYIFTCPLGQNMKSYYRTNSLNNLHQSNSLETNYLNNHFSQRSQHPLQNMFFLHPCIEAILEIYLNLCNYLC